MAEKRPPFSENIRRKSSFSDTLNRLTSNPFGRHRTSGTFESSHESSSSLRRRSRIPTPSLGARTSSLFGELNLNAADNADPLETQGSDPIGRKQVSTLSLRRHSRLPSASTSSFFGNTNSETLYPKEFLDDPEVDRAGKENDCQDPRCTEGHQVVNQLSEDQPHCSLCGEALDKKTKEPRETEKDASDKARRVRGSEDSRRFSTRLVNTPFFKRHLTRQSLAATPQSCSPRPRDHRSSFISSTSTGSSKANESNAVIEQRRLLAPINPTLPRRITLNVAPNTSLASTPAHHSSPLTPSFMRPTSSSAARRTEPSRSFKPPPAPLNITGREKTDMVLGFTNHRERKRAMQLSSGSHRISNGTHPEFLAGHAAQNTSKNERRGDSESKAPVYENGEQTHASRELAEASTAHIVPEPMASEEVDFNRRMRNEDRNPEMTYRPNSLRRASTPEPHASFIANEPVPKIPRQYVAKQNPNEILQKLAAIPSRQKEQSTAEEVPNHEANGSSEAADSPRPLWAYQRHGSAQDAPSRSIPNMSINSSFTAGLPQGGHSRNDRPYGPSRIPRSTSKASDFQPSVNEHDLSTVRRLTDDFNPSEGLLNEKPLPPEPPLSHRKREQMAIDEDLVLNQSVDPEADIARMYLEQKQVNRESPNVLVARHFSPRKSSLKPNQLNRSNFSCVELGSYTMKPDDEEDLTLVKAAQDLRYWAGRLTANDDKLRNEALSSPNAQVAAYSEDERHNQVLQILHEKCVTDEAVDSLATFVKARRGGWTGGGLSGPRRAASVVMPVIAAAEAKGKKKGLMGKVFGGKRS
ncbi:MAG: hypothetical protein Q9170_003283 [Blastenia crenularia]